MAVGVDYSLFYLKREREERARGRSHIDAIEIAAQTSGRAVIVSGLAVIVSMAGMFLVHDVTFASLAVGSILVIAVAVLGSITVLPAVLAKLGRRTTARGCRSCGGSPTTTASLGCGPPCSGRRCAGHSPRS